MRCSRLPGVVQRDRSSSLRDGLPSLAPEIAALREEINGFARQISQYRAALDGGGDPAVLGPWITGTQARKLNAEARLLAYQGANTKPSRMSGDAYSSDST
jgi:hypothetical protein